MKITESLKKAKTVQIHTSSLHTSTKGPGDMIDLTPDVEKALRESGLLEGSVVVFVIGSTAGVGTIENEPGLKKDMKEIWQKLVPQGPHYFHHETWGDRNGFSHVRATIQGPSLVVPFTEGRLHLGRWQQIVLFEFDDRPRHRTITVQFTGIS